MTNTSILFLTLKIFFKTWFSDSTQSMISQFSDFEVLQKGLKGIYKADWDRNPVDLYYFFSYSNIIS